MGKITGFLDFERELPSKEQPAERLRHWREFEPATVEDLLRTQGARCMDCGIPFCHKGCPLGNVIPDWNDLVYRGRWADAIERLHSTNNFPEFTGRVCPAPCEEACVLNIADRPVTIKNIERNIIEHAFEADLVHPVLPERKTGKRVAVVGSGPAGMACAQQLARAGHDVVLFERADRVGGLLRYGIPDFKMEKHLIDRRVEQMAAEGVTFRTSVDVGRDVTGDQLQRDFDAVVLSVGSTKPRDLPVPGRELRGIHFAMEFLPQQNKVNAGDAVRGQITATGKRVVIIGGGDTGSDCLGTSNRQSCASVHQFELLPEPPEARAPNVWPNWPMILRTSTSHEEGVQREWSINTKRFEGDADGNVTKLHGVRLAWENVNGRPQMQEIPDSEFTLDCDLVLLAMGFVGAETDTVVDQLGCTVTERGTIQVGPEYQSDVAGVFACGDARRGQSLVVWAIWEGRECARGVDAYLMGATALPSSPL